jgi:hypothetical protein
MSLVMIKTSQLSPLAFALYVAFRPAGTSVIASSTQQHVQGDLLHYAGLIPDAAPEEFALIGPVGRASQHFSGLVNSCAVADSDGHHQSPKVLPRSWPKMRPGSKLAVLG